MAPTLVLARDQLIVSTGPGDWLVGYHVFFAATRLAHIGDAGDGGRRVPELPSSAVRPQQAPKDGVEEVVQLFNAASWTPRPLCLVPSVSAFLSDEFEAAVAA